jgi:hypothetical protein
MARIIVQYECEVYLYDKPFRIPHIPVSFNRTGVPEYITGKSVVGNATMIVLICMEHMNAGQFKCYKDQAFRKFSLD